MAFTPTFYKAKETQQRWNNFLSSLGKEQMHFEDVIGEIVTSTNAFFEN